MLFNLLEGETSTNNTGFTWIILAVIVVMFIVMTITNNRQRKKQEKQEQEKKDKLCAGTKVITIGGIVGTVKSVNHKDNTFILTTEKTDIKFDNRSIFQMTLPEEAKRLKLEQEALEKEAQESQAEVKESEDVFEAVTKPTADKKSTKKKA